MKQQLYLLKTLSSLHCGVGTGAGDIDLPVAKSPVSGLPLVPGSSMKGVLKDHFLQHDADEKKRTALFGREGADHASALSIGDSSLLALPVRSFYGGFAYLTSPMTLTSFRQACIRAGVEGIPEVPNVGLPQEEHMKAGLPNETVLIGSEVECVLLEEIDLLIEPDLQDAVQKWADFLADLFIQDPDARVHFTRRFIVADDNVIRFLCETALPVDAHIAIDPDTGTVRPGMLWYEESVPPEALFYGVVGVDRSAQFNYKAHELQSHLLEKAPSYLQVGGKATTGKGLVQLTLPRTNSEVSA